MKRLRRERGASSIELALYTPILFLVIFVIVQFSLSWHANQVASATARESARVARADGGGAGAAAIAAAEQHGEDFAAQVGENALRDVDVTVVQVGDDMRATVTGRALEIIDGVGWPIEQTVQGPIERFIPDQ